MQTLSVNKRYDFRQSCIALTTKLCLACVPYLFNKLSVFSKLTKFSQYQQFSRWKQSTFRRQTERFPSKSFPKFCYELDKTSSLTTSLNTLISLSRNISNCFSLTLCAYFPTKDVEKRLSF